MSQWIEYITSPSQSALANERRANGRDKPWKLDYIGVGNEPWGCGGDMRAEYYADEYKKFALNIKTPADNRPIEVASGPYGDGYDWTEVLMKNAVRQMGAYSLHYYTLPSGSFETKNKGPALVVQRSRLDHHAQAHARHRRDDRKALGDHGQARSGEESRAVRR